MTVVSTLPNWGKGDDEGRSRRTGLVIEDVTERARRLTDYDGHEQVILGRDPATGLRAIIAIHDTRLGPALGGCRMWSYRDETAAMTDALRLSRGMTLKAALVSLPFGGGKAVIMGDPTKEKPAALLRSFAHMLDHLNGRYLTAEDVGMGVTDVERVAEASQWVVGTTRNGGDPSPSTASGVAAGIKAAVRHRLGRDWLGGLTVAVQGLGNVGWGVCKALRAEGARLLVADLNRERVARAAHELGATPVDPDAIHKIEADVFTPCALGGVLNDITIPELEAYIIAGSANNQLLEARHGKALRDRDILYAPDFVINAGGLIRVASTVMTPPASADVADAMVEAIGDRLAEIFTRADAEDAPTSAVAEQMATEHLAEAGPSLLRATS